MAAIVNGKFDFNCSCRDRYVFYICMCVKLPEVDILDNRSIHDIDHQVGKDNTDVTWGFFSMHSIKKLPTLSQIFPNLKFLTASKAEIENIDDEFYYSHHLEDVDLKYNKLRKINAVTFFHNHLMLNLDLAHNKISEIEKNAFYGLANLRKLNLSWNKIEKLTSETFSFLTTMEELNLQENLIKELKSNLFARNIHLKFVNLDDNKVEKIYGNIFEFPLIDNVTLSLRNNMCIDEVLKVFNFEVLFTLVSDCASNKLFRMVSTRA